MAASELEILQRAEATLSVAQALAATWVWDEMNVADFAAKLGGARAAQSDEAEAKAAYDEQRGVVEARFSDLERRKVQGLGMARSRFRHDAEQLAMIESVGDYGDSREAILKEGEEWAAAWRRIDPTWNPTTTNTLAAFEALSADCQAQFSTLTNVRADHRKVGAHYNELLAELQDLSVAWYAAATRVFAAGTAEGDLVRGQIPTFASGTSPAPPPAPSPSPSP